MPVILVTSLASDEDRKKGIEAGANAYITKSSFDQRVLLETLRRLI
jgi:two-component system chemotaxis sensor kinase CheA